jgi:hypothetical protein
MRILFYKIFIDPQCFRKLMLAYLGLLNPYVAKCPLFIFKKSYVVT